MGVPWSIAMENVVPFDDHLRFASAETARSPESTVLS